MTASRDWPRLAWTAAMGALGLAIGSIAGLIVALVAGYVSWDTPRPIAYGAACLLAVSALLAIFEAGLSEQFHHFVAARPLASSLGRLAGVLFLIATASFSRVYRAQGDTPANSVENDVE